MNSRRTRRPPPGVRIRKKATKRSARKRKKRSGLLVDAIEPDRRSDVLSIIVSTAAHLILLILGAVIFFGGETQTAAKITTTWDDEPTTVVKTIEEVELIEEPSAGGKFVDPATSAVVAQQTSVSGAAAQAGIAAQPQSGGLGGAFFGVGGDGNGKSGKRIVYIVDASGSMTSLLYRTTRFDRVRRELEGSIFSLHESQQFAVILFNDIMRPIGPAKLRDATKGIKSRTVSRLWESNAGGDTNPRTAIRRALRMRPDTIYFLTDGIFPPANAFELFEKRRGLTVHTFTLGDSSGEAIMRHIAEVNGGTYKFVDGRPPASNQSTAASGSGTGVSNTP